MNRKWGFLCSSHHLCLLTEVCFDCSRPSWCEEKGTGVFAVPFKWNRPRFQCHWLPAVFFFPRVRQQVSKRGSEPVAALTYCHNTCENRVFSVRNQAGFYNFFKCLNYLDALSCLCLLIWPLKNILRAFSATKTVLQLCLNRLLLHFLKAWSLCWLPVVCCCGWLGSVMSWVVCQEVHQEHEYFCTIGGF